MIEPIKQQALGLAVNGSRMMFVKGESLGIVLSGTGLNSGVGLR